MSQENVEEYRRSSDAWSRGDREAWLSDIPADWEFRATGVFLGVQGVYRGRSGAIRLWTDMRGPWQEFSINIERIEDLRDKLVALVTFAVRGRDGIEVSRPWAHVVTYQNGVATVTDNYESWESALKAVGLAE
jgi:ketosteroid isomerase-like protein